MLRLLYRLGDRIRHNARARRTGAAHAQGRRGEDLAHRYLQTKGYVILARNYRTPNGSAELDLVAQDGDITVFVEVKTRLTPEYGSPESAVDPEKRRRMKRGAEDYLHRSGRKDASIRFDIVSVLTDGREQVAHIKDAFHRDL